MNDKGIAYTFRTLHAEVQQDMSDIDDVFDECMDLYNDIADVALPKKHEMLALAAYLHHFYTGAESVFQRVVDAVDQQKPSGNDWHRQLLKKVSLDLPDLRPPVIRRSTHATLDEFRGFRHVFRRAYGIVIDWKRLKLLLEQLPVAHQSFREDVDRFLGFLADAIRREDATDEEERQS